MLTSDQLPVIEAHHALSKATRTCKGVVAEVAKILKPWHDEYCLIGGWAVYALTEIWAVELEPPLRHRGSLDVDIAIGWPEIDENGADAVVSALLEAGYLDTESFRLKRTVDDKEYAVDLMAVPPEGHEAGPVIIGNREFGPFWNGAFAFEHVQDAAIQAKLPEGSEERIPVRIAAPAGLLVIKLHASFVPGQDPQPKHLYDVFALIRTYPGGPVAFVRHCQGELTTDTIETAANMLEAAFGERSFGPRLVAEQRATQEGGDMDVYMTEAEVTVRRFLDAVV